MVRMEQRNIVLFLQLKDISTTAIHHELVAILQEHALSHLNATRFYSTGRLFWVWIRKRPHQPSSPRDDGVDEMNEVILLALSDDTFSSVRQMADSPQNMHSKKPCKSWVCQFSAFRSQTWDIFIGFLTGSPTVRWQVNSTQLKWSRSVDPTSRSPVSHPASRIRWGHILHINPWRVSHDSTCRWMRSWDDLAARWKWEMKSPIGRSAWFRARNWY
jgi:hypothetical protein